MNKLIIRYGIYSSLVLLVFFTISLSLVNSSNYGVSEIAGYAAIIFSMVFVFLGIRQYREEIGAGRISFWQAVKVGLLIVAIPSLVFGLIDIFYVLFINPDFMENYYQHALSEMQANLSADEFAIKSKKMEAEKEMFMNPFMQFVIMSLTVFLIGAVATLLSSFALKTSE